MDTRYSYRKHKKRIMNIIKSVVPVLLSIALLCMGISSYNKLNNANVKFINKIDANIFKKSLNITWPILNMVYNSGSISVSITNEIKDIIGSIFNFDLRNPLTILNTQSSIFHTYYIDKYLPLLAETNEYKNNDYKIDYSNLPDNTPQAGIASSIYLEEETNPVPNQEENLSPDNKINILNETKIKVDIDSLLKEPLKLNIDKKGPKVLIYHTHTSESYIRDLADLNKKDVASSTQDQRYNVVRVGNELAQYLEDSYKISTVHNATVNDYPDYDSSYSNALKTVTNILNSYPSVGIVLDIHRDAVEGEEKLRLVKTADGKKAAQIMFVVATGENGLSHPNWKENLKLALKLQENLNKQYPGLARPIFLTKYRYNQHVSNGAIIVEIGGDGNTLDEALESTKYLAKAINEVVNSN